MNSCCLVLLRRGKSKDHLESSPGIRLLPDRYNAVSTGHHSCAGYMVYLFYDGERKVPAEGSLLLSKYARGGISTAALKSVCENAETRGQCRWRLRCVRTDVLVILERYINNLSGT